MLSIPVVATDTPSISNYIKHNTSGFLIGKKNSPQEFADRLDELYHDIQLQREFTNNLKSFVIENFSEKAYSYRLLTLIQDNY
jgi:glycosyltransferase involved in cell wall biosynthesis